jgi:hypothetical protein
MNIKKRLERVESEICPEDTIYSLLIYGYRNSNPRGMGDLYMKDGKIVGYITAIREKSASGKLVRSIEPFLEKGKKILFELGYRLAKQGGDGG